MHLPDAGSLVKVAIRAIAFDNVLQVLKIFIVSVSDADLLLDVLVACRGP